MRAIKVSDLIWVYQMILINNPEKISSSNDKCTVNNFQERDYKISI